MKEYLDEVTEIQFSGTVQELTITLAELYPQTKNILSSCRFAVDNTFVNDSFQIKESDTVFIIPPSSGG